MAHGILNTQSETLPEFEKIPERCPSCDCNWHNGRLITDEMKASPRPEWQNLTDEQIIEKVKAAFGFTDMRRTRLSSKRIWDLKKTLYSCPECEYSFMA